MPRTCGTVSCYTNGCRCADCRRAAAEARSRLRARVSDIYPEMAWQDDAACKEMDSAIFFGQSASGTGSGSYREARKVCAACPVKGECLRTAMQYEYGLSKAYRAGMYGGLTPEERAALVRAA
jgi:WhiB family redox-sensing transcriptional regulator